MPEVTIRHALLLYNPGSGSTADLSYKVGQIVRFLAEDSNFAVSACPMKPGFSLKEFLTASHTEFELILIAGGDGTVGRALGTISELEIQTPVALVPFGTGNLLAKDLGIYPADKAYVTDYALDIALDGHVIPIDLGKMNDRWFAVNAGIGPFAEAISSPGKKHKSLLSFFAYGIPLIKAIAHPPVKLRVQFDNQEPRIMKAMALFVTNSKEMGIGSKFDASQVTEGEFDVMILAPHTVQEYWRIFMRFASWFLFGIANNDRPYEVLRAKKVKIEPVGRKRIRALIDGDCCGVAPMEISVRHAAVNLCVPKPVADTVPNYRKNDDRSVRERVS